LLLITKPSWDTLLEKIPAFERYFRILIQNNLIATQRRLMGTLSETAEEQYIKLTHAFPECVQRVPQHMIASYLGITPETLSRIRSQMAARK
jgi:CRP-like cAMP-binding protein